MSSYPARRYYERVAGASGFPLAALERVFRQAALLRGLVARVPEELLLRGGTALNLLHLEAPRLSVDLDLDYVGSADAQEAQERRPALLADLATARQRAEELLRVVLRLQPGQLRLLRVLEAGTLDATLLGDRALVQRVQANPGLLWRLQRGLTGLEER